MDVIVMSRNRGENPFGRTSETKEPKRVFLLACEGRQTEKRYFKGLEENKNKLNILEFTEIKIFKKSNEDISNPLKIFEELNEVMEHKGIDANEVCLVVDRDSKSFTEGQYTRVLRGCEENNFNLYLSNPNFELWLLFHFIDEKLSSQQEIDFLYDPKKVSEELQLYLKKNNFSRAITFNKKISFSHYIDRIKNAISVAKKYETDVYNLKDNLGTNVCELVENIINI